MRSQELENLRLGSRCEEDDESLLPRSLKDTTVRLGRVRVMIADFKAESD